MSVWAGGCGGLGVGRGGGGVGWLSGMLQRWNEVRLRILYPLDECTVYDLFAIKSRHIMLQQQSQPLSMVNNIVYSYRFKHASKSQLLLDQHFINPTPSSWNNLPNVILLPFTLKFETSVKLKQSVFFSKSWRILVVVATWRHHIIDVLKLRKNRLYR